MMGFNERVHAYIAAKYYVYLTEKFGDNGKDAFLLATRHYAEQRGRRMAERAVRDGQPLTYETYCKYGEWDSTGEITARGEANKSEVVTLAPDYETHIFSCPWAAQFKDMGLSDAGALYCRDLDASICRGFNPAIHYKTTQTLYDHPYCIQIIRNSGLAGDERPVKRPEGIRPFSYHCGHSYYAYREVVIGIYGENGKEIAAKVLTDFETDYGLEMSRELVSFANTNFNIADENLVFLNQGISCLFSTQKMPK